MLAWLVIGITVLVGLFILGGVIWFSWDSDKRVRAFATSTDLIPGKPSRAPAGWTTATSPEALLHRRIRYAIADVYTNPTVANNADAVAARERLYDAVFALDDHLILAEQVDDEQERTEIVERAETAIEVLEALPTKLWDATPAQQVEDLDAATAALSSGSI